MSRFVGHYAPWLLGAVVGALVLLTVVPAVASLVPWQALAVLLVVALGLGISMLVHNRRLCERCIAALPLDASTAASRSRIRFRVAHLFESRVLALCYLGVVVGSGLLHSHPVGRYAWAAAQASLAYLLLVYVSHQRLQPWCPQCRDGGEELTAPTAPNPLSSPA